jgi:hypothetical protein
VAAPLALPEGAKPATSQTILKTRGTKRAIQGLPMRALAAALSRSYRRCAMVERPPAADDDEARLSHRAKLTIGAVVFALGLLVGAAVAAWIIPPS